MPASHLVLGLDGADLSLIQKLGPEWTPTLHRLMETGAFAALESVFPAGYPTELDHLPDRREPGTPWRL